MSGEFTVLREAWLGLDEPSQELREAAQARLFEEIASEESERLGRPSDQQVRRGGLRRRSRLALVVVLGLLLVLTWATLTLAFGWHVIFGSTPKVPHNSEIYKNFFSLDTGAPAGMASGVISDETRLVANYDGVPLWVAPTRAGGYCFIIGGSGGLLGSGGCDREGTVPLSVQYAASGAPAGSRSPQADLAYLRHVNGFVNPRWSETVEVRFEDGTVVRPPIVWISEPISQGFFYLAIGDDQRHAGHLLQKVVALDADGNLVAEDSSMSQGSERPDGPPAGAVVDEAEQEARLDTPSGEAVLWSAPSRFDSTCTWLALAGHTYGGECLPSGYPIAHVVLIRRGYELLLVSGVGLTRSGLLTLGFGGGQQLRLTADGKGNLLRLFPAPLRASEWPTTFSAVDASGRKLQLVVEPG
jgi:hypothetical protein